MFHYAYSCACRYGVLPFRETAPDPGYEPQTRSTDWSDEQLARIRLVLQRLTALRIQNAEDVEDLVQETMLTMTLKCPQGELKKGLLVWSMGILRKKIGNYYRKAQRYASLNERTIALDSAFRGTLSAQSPEAKVHYFELRLLVEKILGGLPPQEQQAVGMLLAGMAPSRIVERLHPERYQNVINRLYRGRHKLQRELSRHGYGPGKQ
ncbi:MAG TPA: sigma-70 family RNA polymerase sigma factor [Acidobacteriota bacterium]|nr:sigma-70 family RNA polymerase sigma factor [Acidobacteriota bacterium]